MIKIRKQARLQYRAEGIGALLAFCVFILICAAFVLPLGAAISPLFGGIDKTVKKTTLLSEILTPHLLRTALFTFEVALGSTFIALVIGIPAAFFTARRNFFGRSFLLSLSSIPFCIPALIVALGFVSFFGFNGTCNRLLITIFHFKDPPLRFLYSFKGIILAEGFYNFPLVMSIVNDNWERLPSEESNAARLLGAGESRIFRTITVFQLLPAITSAAIPVFLYCFFSFMIVLLFGAVGCSTLEVEIYQAARVSMNFHEAAALALFETSCAFGMILVYGIFEQRASRSRGISFTGEKNVKYKIGAYEFRRSHVSSFLEKSGAVVLFALIIFFFLAPFASIVFSGFFPHERGYDGNFTLGIFEKLFLSKGFRTALLNSLRTAAATGTLSTLTAFVCACMLRSYDPQGRRIFLRTLPLLPMAVSSIVMGFGMTILVRRGSPAVLVIAQTALNWPLAFRQIYPELHKIPSEIDDAARILSKNPLDIIYRIYLPCSWKNILSAFGFAFAISCGDATLPLILSIPHFDTLSLYTYRLAGSYRFTQSCACGAILGLLCAAVFAVANKVKETGVSSHE